MTYDQKCFDLACEFLRGEGAIETAANREALAQAIQRAVEDFIEAALEELNAKVWK